MRDAARGGAAADASRDARARSKDAGAALDARANGAEVDAGAEAAVEIEERPEWAAQRPSFCRRAGDNPVRQKFCSGPPPKLSSLRQLQDLIGVNPRPPPSHEAAAELAKEDIYSIVTVAVFLAHSTALSGHMVSPINPRAILLTDDTAMTFQRGVQLVEIASRSPSTGELGFYLVSFTQRCNERPEGCTPGDLYTPRIESDWTSFTIADDEDLKNTASDCRQCHQRGLERPTLLMRELQSPWTHFFEIDNDLPEGSELPGVRGRDLVRDYLRAKGDEPYGEVPVGVIRKTIGLVLQNFVPPGDQPLLFDAPAIEDERWPYSDGGYPTEPNRSSTWDEAYEAFQRGEQLALPHFEPRPTDPRKQAALTEAYARYRAGELPAEELPDLGDIFPDDPLVRAEIGLQTKPGSTPAQVLIQACGSCHNDVLDQNISRARFNIDLARMSREELELAIARIELPAGAEGVMPPKEARKIAPEARQPLIEFLRQQTRSAADDALLKRAAMLGMAGGAGR